VAQKVKVLITCDYDEDEVEAVETVTFGYDGETYQAEMCQEHLDEFTNWMNDYIAGARPQKQTGRRRSRAATTGSAAPARRSAAAREDLTPMREWARSNGYQISDRGRIPASVRAAYEAAH
jgi:hypothetical protein